MAAFILAMIVNDHLAGQEAALQGNLIAICLEQLGDPNPLLRQWLALCLAKVCRCDFKFHSFAKSHHVNHSGHALSCYNFCCCSVLHIEKMFAILELNILK